MRQGPCVGAEMLQKRIQDVISETTLTDIVSLGLASKLKLQVRRLLNVSFHSLVLGFAWRSYY